MTNTNTPNDDDLCLVCKGDTDGPDIVFHWAGPYSDELVGMTCSPECASIYSSREA